MSQWAFANRTHCKRGHALTEETTRPFPSGQRVCRECARYRDRQHRRGHPVRKTSCPHGHRYTVETTYYVHGKRRCRLCRDFTRNKQYQQKSSYRYKSTQTTCYVVGCRDHAYDGLACVAHRAMLWVLDEEYRAYWRSVGAFA